MAQTPVVLVPGLNAIVQANFGIRQRYKTPGVFTFELFNVRNFSGVFNSLTGVLQTWVTYGVAEMAYIYNNPNNTSTDLNTSAVRIYLPLHGITEYRITQDYTDASVLNGFAAAGGFWTFLGSIIALLFGRTIMQSITGTSACIVLEGHRDNAVLILSFVPFRLETSVDLRASSYGQ